jgi:hypothetical protein
MRHDMHSINLTTVGWRCPADICARRALCREGQDPWRPAIARLTIGRVTIKERLHELVDELSDGEADEAFRYIAERRSDPVVAAFATRRSTMSR